MRTTVNYRAMMNSPGSTVVGDEVRHTIEVGDTRIRIYHRLPEVLLPKTRRRRKTK